jgi:hypothetical protein
MKASELIEQIAGIMKTNGDVDVRFPVYSDQGDDDDWTIVEVLFQPPYTTGRKYKRQFPGYITFKGE